MSFGIENYEWYSLLEYIFVNCKLRVLISYVDG